MHHLPSFCRRRNDFCVTTEIEILLQRTFAVAAGLNYVMELLTILSARTFASSSIPNKILTGLDELASTRCIHTTPDLTFDSYSHFPRLELCSLTLSNQ